MREHDLDINGIRLHCREAGNGPALLLIHGHATAGADRVDGAHCGRHRLLTSAATAASLSTQESP